MTTWFEVRKNIQSISEEEKADILAIADIITIIKQRRNELHLSQRDLAVMTGIKQSAIARFETMRSSPQLSTLLKLIKPLGLKLNLIKDN